MGKIASKRRVDCSASTGPSFNARRGQEEKEGRWKESEAHVVHSWECHVRGTDHKRDKSVSESPDHERHYHKENHYESVSCYDYVINLIIAQKGSRLAEFSPDKDA